MNTAAATPNGVRQPEDFSLDVQFLLALNRLISSARLHRDNNEQLVAAVKDFVALVVEFSKESDEIILLASPGRFYLQQERIPHRANIAGLIDSMLRFFEKRGINGLQFHPSLAGAPTAAITSFARALHNCVKEPEPAKWLENELAREEYAWVDAIILTGEELEEALPDREQAEAPTTAVQDPPRERDKRKKALQAYGYALNSLREISRKVSNDKKASIKKTLRMVHIMIDTVADDNSVLLSLSTIRDYDDYTFTHSLNVALLSMCLGQRIGLNKTMLEMLSLCALFHDLGKIDVPKKILNKPGMLTENEFREMRNHSIYSVRQIINLKAPQKKKAAMMLPPFEHHLKFDLSGYPQTPRKKPVSLFGRIIAIADVFDAITAKRVYRSFPISPDRALSIMHKGAGKDFDPLLLKVFINMIGVYPIGTLLKFDREEMGLVAKYGGRTGEDKELWVQLLKPVNGKGFTKGDLINLGPLNEKTKTFNRPILESLHPAAYNIQPADYIL